jgi:hypothetical protein
MRTTARTALLLVSLACVAPASALAAAKPVAVTGVAVDVSPDAATITGAVNPNGLVTTWYFQYGKTKSYGSRTIAQDAGSGRKRIPVSSQLTGLAGKTRYHYRLVATSGAGRTLGADRTFKTPEAPTVSTIAASPNPVPIFATVVVTGFLVGPRGGGGKQVALEANNFPFTGGFQQIGNTVLTAPNGGYQFVFGSFVTAQLHVVDRSDPSIVSPVLTESVAMRISLKAGHRSRRGVVRFSGHITPPGAASVVVVQRRTKRGGWKNVAVALPRKSGTRSDRWSRRKRVKPGVFRAIGRPGSTGYVEGISHARRVKRH